MRKLRVLPKATQIQGAEWESRCGWDSAWAHKAWERSQLLAQGPCGGRARLVRQGADHFAALGGWFSTWSRRARTWARRPQKCLGREKGMLSLPRHPERR